VKPRTRREFLAVAGATAAVAASSRPGEGGVSLPRRPLGRTGLEVSLVAFGCGSRFLQYKPGDESQAALERALALGINYFDTAQQYGNGESETRLGPFVERHRAQIVLATKVKQGARTRDAALREIEASLKRLHTDRLDVLHAHSLGAEDDLAVAAGPDGVLKALRELRDQKVTRAIGITCHHDGRVLARAIRENDLDVVQIAMNPARSGGLEEHALPAALEKKLGVLLMKVTGQEKLLGDGPSFAMPAELLRYALSLPVSAAVVGMPQLAHLEGNVAVAQAFKPMTAAEMEALRTRLLPHRGALGAFFAAHVDTHMA
jgi:hypothetical protein